MLKVLVLAFIVTATLTLGSSAEYDRLCNKIIDRAQEAARLHNKGDQQGSRQAINMAERAFQDADEIDPHGAQHVLNYGTFMMNTNRFDEAIKLFERAKENMPSDADKSAMVHIDTNLRRCNYGLYSMNRDQTYNNGKGDVEKALYWGKKQLEISPMPQKTHHEVATLLSMLCEYSEDRCEEAQRHFRIAHQSAFQHYQQLRKPKGGKAVQSCLHSRSYLLGEWMKHQPVKSKEITDGLFLYEIDSPVIINGNSGVVTFKEAGDCTVLSTAPDYYLDAAESLIPHHHIQTPQKLSVPENTKVFSTIQFATQSFYHWMCEALPRLVVARQELEDFGSYNVIIPRIGDKTKFVVESISLLFGDLNLKIIEHNGQGNIELPSLAQVGWATQPCPGNGRRTTCHALAHPQALKRTRELLTKHLLLGPFAQMEPRKPYVLIAGRGGGTSMRNFDHDSFVRSVKSEVAKEFGDSVIVEEFSKSSLDEALMLFRNALVVIGAHGGALSNAIACKKGTPLIEIGFSGEGTRHYEHLARALGLPYNLVRVQDDELKRAVGAPTIDFDFQEAAETTRIAVHSVFGKKPDDEGEL